MKADNWRCARLVRDELGGLSVKREMKHKHAELIIAWANGAEIEVSNSGVTWGITATPDWNVNLQYRIKPKRPQWQQDLIDAVKAGKVIEFYDNGWYRSTLCVHMDQYNFAGSKQHQYRIKPKPDLTQTCEISFNFASFNSGYPTVIFTFDGETGKLKAAEVL